MREEILGMLKELRPEHDFENSAAFVEDELLDSFDIISLIDMMEEKYGAEIDALDIVPDNFQSLETIERLVRKSGGTD